MPTYDYECTKGHTFEVTQRISDPPLKRCKICRAKARRLISATGFILKGGGWYADGYSSSRSNGNRTEGASGEKASGDKGSSDSSSKPSKSETKPSSEKS
jgi:putative FmdB family regulatory protein